MLFFTFRRLSFDFTQDFSFDSSKAQSSAFGMVVLKILFFNSFSFANSNYRVHLKRHHFGCGEISAYLEGASKKEISNLKILDAQGYSRTIDRLSYKQVGLDSFSCSMFKRTNSGPVGTRNKSVLKQGTVNLIELGALNTRFIFQSSSVWAFDTMSKAIPFFQ